MARRGLRRAHDGVTRTCRTSLSASAVAGVELVKTWTSYRPGTTDTVVVISPEGLVVTGTSIAAPTTSITSTTPGTPGAAGSSRAQTRIRPGATVASKTIR